MQIKRSGFAPSVPGPEAYFTGTVRLDPVSTAMIPTASAAPP